VIYISLGFLHKFLVGFCFLSTIKRLAGKSISEMTYFASSAT